MFSKLLRVVALGAAVCLLASFASAQANFKTDRNALTEKILNLDLDETNRFQIVKELLDVDPELGFTVLQENWKQLKSVEVKQALLNTFLASANPHIVAISYLGASDHNFNVQNFALNVAESISFRSFADDYNSYLEWYKASVNKNLADVLNEGVRDFVKKYQQADDGTREALLSQIGNRNYIAATRIAKARRKVVLESGIMDILAKSMEPASSPAIQQLAFQMCRSLRPNEAFLRKSVLPLCAKAQPMTLRMQAISLFASSEHAWATPELLKLLVEEYPDQLFYNIGQVLGMIGDAQAIPTLIAMLDADNTRDSALTIGSVLAQITGVFVNEAHDAAWWKNWWQKNKMRLPENLRNAPLPQLNIRKRQAAVMANGVASIRSEVRQADGTPQSSYWLLLPNRGLRNPERNNIQENPPRAPKGLGLLVVLTPGDGNGANMVNNWMDVAQEQLRGRYLVALPVAPRWSADQKITWLTRNSLSQTKEAKFTTEEFVTNIVKDIAANYLLDAERVFVYGSTDSGIAAYNTALDTNTRVRGAYLVNSPFKGALLPPLKGAKGRKFYLHHSREDKTTPYIIAATAQKLLTDNGAFVKLVAYEDANVADLIKQVGTALNWLETAR